MADRLFEDRRVGGDAGHSVLLDQACQPALGEETPVEEVQPHGLPLGLERVQSICHHFLSAAMTLRATLTRLANCEAEPLLQLRERSGRAECAHGHGRAGGPDIAVPAKRARLLDRDAGADRRRQHRVAIALRLLLEQSPARHRHDARADALGGELFVARRAPARPRCRWRAGAARDRRRPDRPAHRRPWPADRPRRNGRGRSSAASGAKG